MSAFARREADFCRKCGGECSVGKIRCDLIQSVKLLFSHKNVLSDGNDKTLLREISASR